MNTIVSQKHKFRFYLTLIIGSLVLFGMSIAMAILYVDRENEGLQKPKDKLLPFVSAGIFILAIYILYIYIKNAPKIQIDDSNIWFNNQQFALSDIKEIKLTGKKNFPGLGTYMMETTTLQFTDGQTKYIYDDMYQNAWQLKLFLKQVVIDKTGFSGLPVHQIDRTELDSEFYDVFKGNGLFSLRGLMLWGFIGAMIYLLLTVKPKNPSNRGTSLIFIACISVFWFFPNSFAMNYFEVSQSFLVIRNHNFWWRRKAYRLSDIKEVVFETRGKLPNCLRVITADFRNRLYLAGTLTNKTWLNLKDTLEGHGVTVRNECIPEYRAK